MESKIWSLLQFIAASSVCAWFFFADIQVPVWITFLAGSVAGRAFYLLVVEFLRE
jgi:hypothetical protein